MHCVGVMDNMCAVTYEERYVEAKEIHFRGNYVKSEIEWLLTHAKFDEKGVCRCIKTGERIQSRIVHRVRLKTQDVAMPFIPFSSPGAGDLISFVTLWCSACSMQEVSHLKIWLADILVISDAEKTAD